MVVSLYIEGATSPDMLAYGRVILDQLQHQSAPAFFYFVRRLMQLGHMHQASVLDIGCGYGWTSAAIALLGANTVTANDIRPGMIQAILGRTSGFAKMDSTSKCIHSWAISAKRSCPGKASTQS